MEIKHKQEKIPCKLSLFIHTHLSEAFEESYRTHLKIKFTNESQLTC